MARWLLGLVAVLSSSASVAGAHAQENPNLEALDAFLGAADEAMEQQDYLAARSLLRDALAIKDNDGTAKGYLGFVQNELDEKASFLYSVARKHLEDGEPRRAWITCQSVVQLQDDLDEPYHRGCEELAESVWLQLCGDLPDDPAIRDAQYLIGRSDWLRGKAALARAENPDDPRVFLLNSQIERGLEAAARSQYRRALVLRAINAWADARAACNGVHEMVDADHAYYRQCTVFLADLERAAEGLSREIRRQDCERHDRAYRYVRWRRTGDREALHREYSGCKD